MPQGTGPIRPNEASRFGLPVQADGWPNQKWTVSGPDRECRAGDSARLCERLRFHD